MRVHPEKCSCKTCKKKRAKSDKELSFVRRSMFLLVVFLVICL